MTTFTLKCSICGYVVHQQEWDTEFWDKITINIGDIAFDYIKQHGFVCPQCHTPFLKTLQLHIERINSLV